MGNNGFKAVLEILARVAAASFGGYYVAIMSLWVTCPLSGGFKYHPYGVSLTVAFVAMGLTAGAALAWQAARPMRSCSLILYTSVVAAHALQGAGSVSWESAVYVLLLLGTARFVCRKWPQQQAPSSPSPASW